MGLGGSESSDEDALRQAASAEADGHLLGVIAGKLQVILERGTHACQEAETTAEHAEAERHQGHCFMAN